MLDTLKKVKKSAEIFLTYQLTMIQNISELNSDEIKEFNLWYKEHPLYKIIPDIQQSMKQFRNERNIKSF